jgi:hypothetical protein
MLPECAEDAVECSSVESAFSNNFRISTASAGFTLSREYDGLLVVDDDSFGLSGGFTTMKTCSLSGPGSLFKTPEEKYVYFLKK